MASKKDSKGKDKSKSSTNARDSPDEGGFLGVKEKPKAVLEKERKKDQKTDARKGVTASVGQTPSGPPITPPQKGDQWAQKQPLPKEPAKPGKEKLIQSEKMPASKFPDMSKSSASVKSPSGGKSGNRGKSNGAMGGGIPEESRNSGKEEPQSPQHTVPYVEDEELPDDFNTRPQPQRSRSPLDDDSFQESNNASFEENNMADSMADYNNRNKPKKKTDKFDETEFQASMYASSNMSSMSATRKDERLCDDIERKIREAEGKYPPQAPISQSMERRVREVEERFGQNSPKPSSSEANTQKKVIISNETIYPKKKAPSPTDARNQSPETHFIGRGSTAANAIEKEKPKMAKDMEPREQKSPIAPEHVALKISKSKQKSRRSPLDPENNPLLPLLKHLLEEKFLTAGMAGHIIHSCLEQYIYGQMDQASQEQKSRYSAQELKAIIEMLQKISVHDLEELADQVISKYGNLLTENTLTAEEINGQFVDFEKNLEEEYRQAAGDPIIAGRQLEALHKSGSRGGSRSGAAGAEGGSVARMVETMSTMYSDEADPNLEDAEFDETLQAAHHTTSGTTPHATPHGHHHHHHHHHRAGGRPAMMMYLMAPRVMYMYCREHGTVHPHIVMRPLYGGDARGAYEHRRDRRVEEARAEARAEPRADEPRWNAGLRSNPEHADNSRLAGREDPEPARPDVRDRQPPRPDVRDRQAPRADVRDKDRPRADGRDQDPRRAAPESQRAGVRDREPQRAAPRAPEPQRVAPRAPEAARDRAARPGGRDPRPDAPRGGAGGRGGRRYDPGLAALFRMAPAFTGAEWQEVERNPFAYISDLPFRRLPGHWMESRHFTGQNYEAMWDLAARIGMRRERGLDEGQIRALKRVRFTLQVTVGGTKEEVECPICLVEYKHKEELVELKCGHRFHGDCIKEWVKSHATCPVCRQDLGRR